MASKFKPVIGLEVHAQILSKSKLFSPSSTKFASLPNTMVSLFDASIPGALPTINKFCIEQAIKTSLALRGTIAKKSQFDRKHYFYPDMPTAYQITQFFEPIMREGYLEIEMPDSTKKVKVARLQVENDSGKSIHDQDEHYSLIDLNRAGIGLMEIVTYPDLNSSKEAEAFMKSLQFLLRHIGTCDGNFEHGSLRCDVNVSITKPNGEYGNRCEVKNVTGIHAIVSSIEYEIKRQTKMLKEGHIVQQETRTFDAKKNQTLLLRTKENAPDYRFFPDPDLPPLLVDPKWIETIRNELPEFPEELLRRYQKEFELSKYDAIVLLHANGTSFFEKLVIGRNPKKCVHWVTSELFGFLNKEELTLSQSPISVEQLGSIIDMIESSKISNSIGKQLFGRMCAGEKKLAHEMVDDSMIQSFDPQIVESLCAEALKVQDIEKMKINQNMFNAVVGSILKQNKKLNPKLVADTLRNQLNK
jgi:aspartyl-tRNA(Asn)/glutamyl-tRNA(Gln) amidotransferase subunit B